MIFRENNVTKDLIKSLDISVKIDNYRLARDNCTKYLGIIIDEKLNWSDHVESLVKKISSLIGIVYRRKYAIPTKCTRNIYFALDYSSLVYGIGTYCNTTLTILKPLIIKCNSLLRVLQDKPRRYKTIDLHKNYNTLPVNQLYNLFAAKLMHRFYFDKNNIPYAINEMFVVTCDIHN